MSGCYIKNLARLAHCDECNNRTISPLRHGEKETACKGPKQQERVLKIDALHAKKPVVSFSLILNIPEKKSADSSAIDFKCQKSICIHLSEIAVFCFSCGRHILVMAGLIYVEFSICF